MEARSNWAGMVAGLRTTPQDIRPVYGVVSGNRFIPVPYIMRADSYVELRVVLPDRFAASG